MIVTYNWLSEFVDIPHSPEELSHILTMLGLEVEGMEKRFADLDLVVVARVLEKNKHPNADKLSLCKVDDGSEIYTIVCGAQNFAANDTVALAKIGAVLPGDFRIKRSKIRGEESFGMLCSEKELGLADESAGIMVLPPGLPLGVPLFEALGLKDTIFEIGLTPNRADCLSVIGIAREIAAKLGTKIRQPDFHVTENGPAISTVATVEILAPDLCPRYTARHISGCKIAPSPSWLANRLKSVGIRSINNVVDVTNYVLMEYGHPLHAFDHDLLAGHKIIVQRAGEGEEFGTLDGQIRQLGQSDLTIRDGERAVALAGIMGGGNSEISEETTSILLESAYFDPSAIRKTSKRLGLHTESSHRFERGADMGIVTRALERAASLIAQIAGGTVSKGIIDVYPVPQAQRTVRARLGRIKGILGIELTEDEVIDLFRRLEFDVQVPESGTYDVSIPSFRVDIEREIDLVEEIARLKGYEHIPTTMPVARVFSDLPAAHHRLERKLRNLMVSNGFSEVINFSFFAPDSFDKISLAPEDFRRDAVTLRNPLLQEQSVMRTSLLPSLLDTVSRNLNYRVMTQRIFELRRVYQAKSGQELPHEPLYLSAVLTGRRMPEGWNQERSECDFFDAKGVVETILHALNIGDAVFSADNLEAWYHPGKACTIMVGNDRIGSLGEIHPDVQERFGISQSVLYAELNFEKLLHHQRVVTTAIPPARFPDVTRDVAILIDDEVLAGNILAKIRSLSIREIADVGIFDLYKGESIPAGKKSIAIRIRYNAQDRTLTDEEVNDMHQRVLEMLSISFNVTIR